MSQLSLMADPRFWPLFWTQFLGAFNDNFLKNALIMLVTYRGLELMGLHKSQLSLLVGALFILMFFMFSATAGQLADRYEKRRIIWIIKTIELILMAISTVGFVLIYFGKEHAGAWLALGALIGMGVHSAFFGPLKYSILPQLLGHDRSLVAGNALVEMGTQLAILLGILGGGALVVLVPYGPLYVSLGLLLAASAGLAASLRIPQTAPGDPHLHIDRNPLMPTWKILRAVYPHRGLWLSIMGNSWFWFYGFAYISLFPNYAKDVLHGNPSVFTLFMATFSIGVAVGSVLCERLSYGRLELGLVPFGSIGMTIFGIDLFLCGAPTGHLAEVGWLTFLSHWNGARIVINLFLLAMFSGFFIVPLYTVLQQWSEPAERSRVIAANNIINSVFIVVGAGVVGMLIQAGLTIPQVFLVLAVMNAVVAVYIYTLLPEFFLRFCVFIVAHVMYRFRSSGLEHIPHDGPAVLVCNHVSFVDWLLIAADVRRPVRFVMALDYARMPLLQAIFRDAKVIPIASARKDPSVLEKAFERISEELRAGELVCIFPEGKITPDGNLCEFRPGIERIIERDPVPVIPMALLGLWGSFFSRKGGRAFKSFRGFRARVRLVVGPPVPPEQVSAERLQEIVGELGKDGSS